MEDSVGFCLLLEAVPGTLGVLPEVMNGVAFTFSADILVESIAEMAGVDELGPSKEICVTDVVVVGRDAGVGKAVTASLRSSGVAETCTALLKVSALLHFAGFSGILGRLGACEEDPNGCVLGGGVFVADKADFKQVEEWAGRQLVLWK